jgi:antagonist of KipI
VKGARAYVAVAGGIDVPPVLGSRATHLLTRMGGFEGRALRGGDVLRTFSTGSHATPRNDLGSIPDIPPAVSMPDGGAMLRVIPGPRGLGQLESQRYRVSSQSNRMGYRLDGPAVFAAQTGEMISAAMPTGAIQVPPAGEPILLMADHATTGGYAVVATVISADLPLAGQLAPGDWVEFQPCALEDADAALGDREAIRGRY